MVLKNIGINLAWLASVLLQILKYGTSIELKYKYIQKYLSTIVLWLAFRFFVPN